MDYGPIFSQNGEGSPQQSTKYKHVCLNRHRIISIFLLQICWTNSNSMSQRKNPSIIIKLTTSTNEGSNSALFLVLSLQHPLVIVCKASRT